MKLFFSVFFAVMIIVHVSAVSVDPAEVVNIKGEKLKLSKDKPNSWRSGTKLKHLQTIRKGVGNTAPGALIPTSVVVRKDGKILEKGKDYLIDERCGVLGIGPNSSVTPDDVVEVDYAFSLRRIDSVVKNKNGKEFVIKGKSNLTVPIQPEIKKDEKRLKNIYIPYHSDGTECEIFQVLETVAKAPTLTTPGKIPETLKKIKAGQPVKIVCWGDSVTAGGDATRGNAYVNIFTKKLKAKFPKADITVKNISVGGSNSRQWLWPDKYKHFNPKAQQKCRWKRIEDEKPDLVTIEFVNDSNLRGKTFNDTYNEMLKRLKKLNTEVIFITPHFTKMTSMRLKSLKNTEETRIYVKTLKKFAQENNKALADASSRWAHLWKEGIPYETMLKNGINHPDDRGHLLFAEELMKCFQ